MIVVDLLLFVLIRQYIVYKVLNLIMLYDGQILIFNIIGVYVQLVVLILMMFIMFIDLYWCEYMQIFFFLYFIDINKFIESLLIYYCCVMSILQCVLKFCIDIVYVLI